MTDHTPFVRLMLNAGALTLYGLVMFMGGMYAASVAVQH